MNHHIESHLRRKAICVTRLAIGYLPKQSNWFYCYSCRIQKASRRRNVIHNKKEIYIWPGMVEKGGKKESVPGSSEKSSLGL